MHWCYSRPLNIQGNAVTPLTRPCAQPTRVRVQRGCFQALSTRDSPAPKLPRFRRFQSLRNYSEVDGEARPQSLRGAPLNSRRGPSDGSYTTSGEKHPQNPPDAFSSATASSNIRTGYSPTQPQALAHSTSWNSRTACTLRNIPNFRQWRAISAALSARDSSRWKGALI